MLDEPRELFIKETRDVPLEELDLAPEGYARGEIRRVFSIAAAQAENPQEGHIRR
jgi:hypothetical protein